MIIIASKENISVKIDYLSIVFDTMGARDVINKILGLNFWLFNVRNQIKIKYKDYNTLYYLGDIEVYGYLPTNNVKLPDVSGCYLVLKGAGCYDYSNLTKESFRELFKNCTHYLDNDKYHATRLDIAIDDKNNKPYFTMEQIKKKCQNGEFISQCNSYRFNESSFENGTAKTIYIGNGKSNLSFRFYDKDKEQCMKRGINLEEIGSWKRTEIQLRDEKAQSFANEIVNSEEDLGQLAFSLLSSSLRFIDIDNNDTNKSRQKTCKFWQRFLGSVKPLKLNTNSEMTDLMETQKWLIYGGALSAMKAFSFLEDNQALGDLSIISNLIMESRYSDTLTSKIVSHLCAINRQDLIPLVHANSKNQNHNRKDVLNEYTDN